MIEFIKKMCIKYREIIVYGICGVLTTLVNIGSFALLKAMFDWGESIIIPNTIAFVISVIFAYITNRIWVFRSTVKGFKGIVQEFISFSLGRAFGLVLDGAIMFVTVDVMRLEYIVWKVIANIIVIAVNFIIGKFLVFRKTNKENK